MLAIFRPLALAAGLTAAAFLPTHGQALSGVPSAPAPDGSSGGGSALSGPSPSLTSPTDAAREKIGEAVRKMNANDIDGCLADLTQAIQLKPDSSLAYILRASVYLQKHQFAQSQADYDTAEKLDPKNPVIKLQIAELSLVQKKFDAARAGYAPLVNDPQIGDFATYKVFLCDLFSGNEAQAKTELDAFNNKGEGASYYFANAAWDLHHKDIEGARTWLTSASHIFAPRKFTSYGQSLRDFGYLPLPLPKDGSVQH